MIEVGFQCKINYDQCLFFKGVLWQPYLKKVFAELE